MTKPAITIHTDELGPLGVDLVPIQGLSTGIQSPHRDDHHMFILQQKGMLVLEVDFYEIKLSNASLCFIAPGQVHRFVKQKDCSGWWLFVETGLVTKRCREVFDTYLHMQQYVSIQQKDAIFDIIPILTNVLTRERSPLQKNLVNALVESTIVMIASHVMHSRYAVNEASIQKHHIVTQFRKLVNKKYKELKQVKEYASLLSITPLYLNEVVKKITGFPSSYWIHQEIMLEAKRLLYYTNLDVKEIAYELGYEDPAYFSRFFKNNAGLSAAAFRSKNHVLSNNSH